jgi:hypothetical protein
MHETQLDSREDKMRIMPMPAMSKCWRKGRFDSLALNCNLRFSFSFLCGIFFGLFNNIAVANGYQCRHYVLKNKKV